MSAHTPGPWAQHPTYPWIIKQDCTPIAEPSDGVTICSTTSHHDSGFFPSANEGRANARLIAAAPELLQALQHLVTMLKAGGYGTAHADAVLAKATGAAL